MLKRKIYHYLSLAAWLLFGAGLVTLLVSATSRKQLQTCSGVIVNIHAIEGKVFIDEQEVKEIVSRLNGGKILSQPVNKFNLKLTEQVLKKEVWIQDAQLYFDNKQVLHANIIERYPVARVFDAQGMSYYLDSSGLRLPLSFTDRADVPVFTQMPAHNKNNDSLYKIYVKQVVQIARAIGNDEFWNAQAAQIEVQPGFRYRMYPAVGNHEVELGDVNNMPDKLERLKTFYRKVFGKDEFVKYNKLNVSYRGQLVASVSSDSVNRNIDPVKAVQVFSQLVQQNKKETNANAVESSSTAGRIMHDNDVGTPPPRQKKKEEAKPPPPNSSTVVKADSIQKPKAVMPQKISSN